MRTFFSKLGVATGLVLLTMGCTEKEIRVYDLEPQVLYQNASEKQNLKNDQQFISILYADLFGKQISATEMAQLSAAYTSFGDKVLVIDLLCKSLLANPSAQLPSNTEMRADVDGFINDAFQRFYIRKPQEQERWFFAREIEQNPDLTPLDVYYALVTAEEYRYY